MNRDPTKAVARGATERRQSRASSDGDSDRDDGTAREHGVHRADSQDPKSLSQIRCGRVDLSKRYVFLCPTSLSKHFDSLPHQAKDRALLVFRCSRKCLFTDPARVKLAHLGAKTETGLTPRQRGLAASAGGGGKVSIATALYRREHSKEFLRWIRTKEKEGCVFWYKPERDLDKMSKFFEEKIDHVNERPYRPLLLDPDWWRLHWWRVRSSARYVGSPTPILSALAADAKRRGVGKPLHGFGASHLASTSSLQSVLSAMSEIEVDVPGQDLDLPGLQELIYQSNPSLEPLLKWPHASSIRYLPRMSSLKLSYVQQEPMVTGIIENAGPRSATVDHSRLAAWPKSARDRYDDLHSKWQHLAFIKWSTYGYRHLSRSCSGDVAADRADQRTGLHEGVLQGRCFCGGTQRRRRLRLGLR